MADNSHGFELKEPASPEALIPATDAWVWWAVAAAVLLVAAVLIILLRRKSKAVDPLAQRNAAFAEAGTALSQVHSNDPRDAAIQCSLILRRYLATAANDPALYETHEEFIARHDSLQALTPEARSMAGSAFKQLAEWKYAPVIPETDPKGIVTGSHTLLETLHRGFAA